MFPLVVTQLLDLCRHREGSYTEEARQTAILRLLLAHHRHPERFAQVRNSHALARTILRNTERGLARRDQRRRWVPLPVAGVVGPRTDEWVQRDFVEYVRRRRGQPYAHAAHARLHALTVAEAAITLGISQRAVERRFHELKELARQWIQGR